MKNTKTPLFSAIITTKNEEQVIEALLQSLVNQSYKNIEIILVDNNSTDRTCEIAKKYTNKVYTKGPERSAQRNYGVEKAKGQYVYILDADMYLQKDVVKEAVGNLEQNQNIGALVVPEKSFGKGFWTPFKVFEREFYEGEEDIEAARIFRKDLFEKFGGYDLSITGPEDWDLPLRMRKAGIKIGRVKSYALHNEKVFNPWKSAKKKFYYASGAAVYLKRHPDKALSQGNLLFRSVFIKKWKKIISHPILSAGMLFVRSVEMAGALLGYFYGTVIKNR